MFEKLQRKWKVNGIKLLLILITFTLGGSACGYLGKKIIGLFEIDLPVVWLVTYIIIVTIIWPICVLIISIPLGQFTFFKKYIIKIFNRFSGKPGSPLDPDAMERSSQLPIPGSRLKGQINLAIFASGAGSNAQKIIEHFANDPYVKVLLVVSNKPKAGVITIAQNHDIDTLVIDKERFFKGDGYIPELNKYHINKIILAGFLWKIPDVIIKTWPDAIINIHPALLPKYGGKGMYGNYVHEAVIAHHEKESGITIHYVDEIYDHGRIIMQARCPVLENDTAESLAQKIHQLEHFHYPVTIEEIIKSEIHVK